MRLSISNIGWESGNDIKVYELMQKYGFIGLEIAPTRIFPQNPYGDLEKARIWAGGLKNKYGFDVVSMQSIWYGRSEKLFGTPDERQELISYTKKAIEFATASGCGNLVFGCPRNRALPDNADEAVRKSGIDFFRAIGEYAAASKTAVGMEANPAIYNTNYINTTPEAFELIEKVGSEGFLLNLDVGTMIYNNERVEQLEGKCRLINHVHISEPGLSPIAMETGRSFHRELSSFLKENDYSGYVSIEMGKTENIGLLSETLDYIREIFG
jgi:sugar phosphate isomerase/epimerase